MASCPEAKPDSHLPVRLSSPPAGPATFVVVLVLTACASVPPVVVPVVTWEEKLDWIIRLEDRRLVRDPNPPEPAVLVPATNDTPAVVSPRAPSDLIRLLVDDEARVRRRASLALGRVGDPEAVEPLSLLLGDPEPVVRRMAAFALGLIGDEAARPALVMALDDPESLVQARAAEALGAIGEVEDALAVAAMVRRHVDAGALQGIAPDELRYPLSPEAEAVRFGVFALGHLRAYGPLARAVLDESGNPVSTWWPIAYAFSAVGDQRAGAVLLVLLESEGRFAPAFAARGIGALESVAAQPWLEQVLEDRTRPPAVIVQAIRALTALGGEGVSAHFVDVAASPGLDPYVRLEAVAALAVRPDPAAGDLLLDLLAHENPGMRGGAFVALARLDPILFLGVLSGMDPDPDWSVRAMVARALGSLVVEQAQPRLLEMLENEDGRVIPAVLAAMRAIGATGMRERYEALLGATDTGVRLAAIDGLAELEDRGAVPALIAALEASRADEDYTVRAAILGALDTLFPDRARPYLEEALSDPLWPVRLRASELLRGRGVDATATAGDPPPAWTGPKLTAADREALLSPPFSPVAYLETPRGNIELELAILDAPVTVANFMMLARQGFFDGQIIHRVVPDFVVQGGDPRGDGLGGPGYALRDEINQRPYLRGTVGMARDWADTGGSQFFITHGPQPHLNGVYTVFGTVVAGMETVDRIQQGDRLISVRIWDGITPP